MVYPDATNMEGRQCPGCKDGKLTLRRSFIGLFWGCTNYGKKEPDKCATVINYEYSPCVEEGCNGKLIRKQHKAKGHWSYICNICGKDYRNELPIWKQCAACRNRYLINVKGFQTCPECGSRYGAVDPATN